jgi:hypothetical protein
MSYYDDMTVIDFLKQMPSRLDGIVTICVIGLFIFGAVVGPVFDLRIGRLSGWNLSASLLGFMPFIFVYYTSLVVCSSKSRFSSLINSILVGATPVFFFVVS